MKYFTEDKTMSISVVSKSFVIDESINAVDVADFALERLDNVMPGYYSDDELEEKFIDFTIELDQPARTLSLNVYFIENSDGYNPQKDAARIMNDFMKNLDEEISSELGE